MVLGARSSAGVSVLPGVARGEPCPRHRGTQPALRVRGMTRQTDRRADGLTMFRLNDVSPMGLSVPRRPSRAVLCSQMIMMVGLPGSGKTSWANKYTAEHPELKVNILGTNCLIDRMKVRHARRAQHQRASTGYPISLFSHCVCV